MNFLAHQYLAGDSESLKIGNFIADAVKGNALLTYTKSIQQGIVLHRQIDFFTDTHPVFLNSCKRLRKIFGHYAPVIVDIFYDHFLASKWNLYSPHELSDFASASYSLLHNESDWFPDKMKITLHYMSQQNWLLNYANIEGIQKTLNGLASRTKYSSGMENAAPFLINHYKEFEFEFEVFFEEIINYTKEQIASLN